MFQLREPSFFFFWSHHAACRISVPRPEIKPGPGSESVESFSFFFLIKSAWASFSIPCMWKSPYCFTIPERLQGSGIPKMSQSIPDKHKVWVSSKLMEAWAALTKVLYAKGGRWEGSCPIQNLTHCLSKLQQSQVQNRQTTVLKTLTSTSKVEQLYEHTGLAWPREEYFWKEPKSCLLSILGRRSWGRVSQVALVVKNTPADAGDIRCRCRRRKRHRLNPWVGKIPWRRAWQPTPVVLPGESQGQGSLAGYGPWGRRESDMTEQTWHTHTHVCVGKTTWPRRNPLHL